MNSSTQSGQLVGAEYAPVVRRVKFSRVIDDTAAGRRITFGVSIPWIAGVYRSAGASIFCILALIPAFLWTLRDQKVWPWDQAWYGEVSVDLWYFFTHSPGEWSHLMAIGMNMKPPGIVWLGQFFVPFAGLFGSIETALLFSILITQLIVLLLIYCISRDLAPSSPIAGIIAVAATAGSQIFAGLSLQYLVEPLQCLAVTWTVLIALRCRDWPPAKTLIHLAAATLCGMLAKASTPAYTLVPTAFIVYGFFRNQKTWSMRAEWRSLAPRVLVSGFIVSAVFATIWYGENYAAVLQHVKDASSGEIGLAYGYRAALSQKYMVWLRFLEQGFLEPYLGWALGLLLIAGCLAMCIARVSLSSWHRRLIAAGLTCVQIALVLYLMARSDAVEPRYLYPLLPYVAVIVILLCSAVRYRPVLAVVLVTCFAQWVTVNRASFETKPILTNQFPWLQSIVMDGTPKKELSEVIRRTSTFQGYNIVAIEEPSLNANSAAFFAAKNRMATGVRSYYTSIGYAEKDPSAAMKRIDEFRTRYVITLDESAQSAPNFLNVATLGVLHELEHNGRFTRVPFPSEKGILIFERQSP